MQEFLDYLRGGIQSCGLSGRHVLLGVSGGPDSVALLLGLLRLRNEHSLTIIAAHLNHRLRSSQADDDEQWVRELTDLLKVPLVVARHNVQQAATAEQRGLEETARRMRYDFLARAAQDHSCLHIVVAHNADDQAETVLHHILRGTGLAGLRGMPWLRPVNGDLVLARPLLETPRVQIEMWLAQNSQTTRHDSSNDDACFTRNRIRRELMPLLQTNFNPQIEAALRRLALQAAETEATLQCVAEQILSTAVVDRTPRCCRLNCDKLAGWPRHLIRVCMLLLWKQQNWPRRSMGFAAWNRLADVVVDGGRASLPSGFDAQRRNALLCVHLRDRP